MYVFTVSFTLVSLIRCYHLKRTNSKNTGHLVFSRSKCPYFDNLFCFDKAFYKHGNAFYNLLSGIMNRIEKGTYNIPYWSVWCTKWRTFLGAAYLRA